MFCSLFYLLRSADNRLVFVVGFAALKIPLRMKQCGMVKRFVMYSFYFVKSAFIILKNKGDMIF